MYSRSISGILAAALMGAIALTLVTPAQSQEAATGGGAVQVIQLTTDRRNSHGRLDACELVYLVAFADNIYRQGAVTALRGSVSIMGFTNNKDKAPGILLKVTAFDVVNDKPVFAPLSEAYLSAQGKSYAQNAITNFTCDDGGKCVGYQFLENLELAMALSDGFEINIVRANGNSDVRVPIKLFPKFAKQSIEFSQCSVDLAEELQKKMSE